MKYTKTIDAMSESSAKEALLELINAADEKVFGSNKDPDSLVIEIIDEYSNNRDNIIYNIDDEEEDDLCEILQYHEYI